jgi:tripartite-type tricarboxylate transporter receptor subunit TctC
MTLRILFFICGLAFGLPAFAQAYPAKPIKIVVGFPPGGSGDFLTRLIADETSMLEPLVRESGAKVE